MSSLPGTTIRRLTSICDRLTDMAEIIDERRGEPGEALLAVEDIVMEFPGVRALDGISFDVFAGEIHCLVGENGAGKSTLMKILSGAYAPGRGAIRVGGESYRRLTPSLAKELGIAIVYQENDLVPTMNVVENIFVGSERTKRPGLVDFAGMRGETRQRMKAMGIELPLDVNIEDLSVSDQQFVKILKALTFEPRVMIMDEPTSMFNTRDAGKVLNLARRIAAEGIGIIYISHFLNEIVSIADRITVVRDGSQVSTYNNAARNTDISVLTSDMVGRPLDMFYRKEKSAPGDVLLEVRNLRLRADGPGVSFKLREGEILGFAGMVGAGRSEIARALIGADPRCGGTVLVRGREVRIRNPGDGIREGFAFTPEDRQRLGLMLNRSILENMLIAAMISRIKGLFFRLRSHEDKARRMVEDLRIKTPSVWTEALNLSGGNQQKVVLAKWLMTDQSVYIFDEPTRGIDINAKAEFYGEMSRLTREGKGIIMISSDMPELISMSDRVLIIRNGKVEGELTGEGIDEEEIIRKALGVKKDGR